MDERLFICQNTETGQLTILNRFDVDENIKYMEESGDMEFTVLGNLNPQELKDGLLPFLVTFKMKTSVIYDVAVAKTKEEATEKVLSKKRYLNKGADVKNVRDLTEYIKQYYE